MTALDWIHDMGGGLLQCRKMTIAGSPDANAVVGGEVEIFAGLDVEGFVPGIGVAHDVGAVLSGRVSVGEDLATERGFAGFGVHAPQDLAPPPPPPPTPTPAPIHTPYHDLFVAGDYIISPKIYNEFSPGNTGTSSYAVRGAYEFSALNIPWMIEGSFEQYGYPHNCGANNSTVAAPNPQCFVTGINGGYSTFVPAFSARDTDVDARLAIRVLKPRVYIGVGYLWRSTNYGYPNMNGVGFGIEKLPDLNEPSRSSAASGTTRASLETTRT